MKEFGGIKDEFDYAEVGDVVLLELCEMSEDEFAALPDLMVGSEYSRGNAKAPVASPPTCCINGLSLDGVVTVTRRIFLGIFFGTLKQQKA